MKMQRMTAAAISDEVRPAGENHSQDGSTACDPAESLKTLASATTLNKIKMANWIDDQDVLQPLGEHDAAVAHPGHHRDEARRRS